MHIPAQPWRSPRLCESLISRGIFFLAKPQRALRHAYPQRSLGVLRAFARASFLVGYFFSPSRKGRKGMHPPCAALAFSAPLREAFFPRDIFLAKPQRAQRHAYPCGALAFSAPLREPHFSRYIFSRQAAMGAKACTPLRSLCVLRDFARTSFPAGYFSRQAAKGAKACIPLRSLGEQCTQCREGLHALPCTDTYNAENM